jgi:hypothetical protein
MNGPVVIFDCDGVLVDSEPLACAVQAEQLARAGLAITAEEVALRYAGMSAADMRRAIEQQLGRPLPEDHEARSADALKKVFQSDLRPVAGMPELLKTLDALGVVCGVASSSSPERIELALRLVGFWDFFAPMSSARAWSRAASRRRTCSSSRPTPWEPIRPAAWSWRTASPASARLARRGWPPSAFAAGPIAQQGTSNACGTREPIISATARHPFSAPCAQRHET